MLYKAVGVGVLLASLSACVHVEPAGTGEPSQGAGSDAADVGAQRDVAQDTSALTDAGVEPTVDVTTEPVEEVAPENQPPIAVAVDRMDVRLGDVATFDGSDSSDPDGTVVAYRWDFGDGATTSDGATVEHVYAVAGVYAAQLEVEDDGGLTDSADVEVRVTAAANRPPTAIITPPADPIAVDVEVEFSAASSSDADGTILSYGWEFREASSGDTVAIGNGVTTTRAFDLDGTYEVRLEVLDNYGAVGSDVHTFEVHVGPAAAFTMTPEVVEVGEPVAFDASGSTDADGTIQSYGWDFADGSDGEGVTVSHAWSTEGSYEVGLTVSDDHGLSAMASKTVLVGSPNLPPTAEAGADQVVLLGTATSFDATGSTDADGSIASYHWAFGDGAEATTATAFHTYAAAGVYEATLTVTDDGGASAQDSVGIRINRKPTPVINVLTGAPAEDSPVSFSSLGSSDPDGDSIIARFWTFGDGADSTAAEPAHTYASPGTYTVTLSITDEYGAQASTAESIDVACVGDCSASDLWRVLPFDSEETVAGACNFFVDVYVGPATCQIEESAGTLTMDCGGEFVYSGTRSGDNFSVSVAAATVSDPTGICGDAYFYETISGSFVNADRWEGSSDLYVDFELWDPFFCYDCAFDPFPKTGTRVE